MVEPQAVMLRLMGVKAELLGGLLGCAVLVGCAGPHSCTLVGANPGLYVTGGMPGGVVTVCTGDQCRSIQTGPGGGFLDLPSLVVGKQTLRATYKRGRATVTSQVQIDARKHQPNGPDCPPTVAVANLVVRPDGHVLQVTK